MKYITYLNLITKVIFTLLIFVFVKTSEDYPLVLLFFGLGNLISGIIGVFLAIKQFNLSPAIPKFSDITLELKTGWGLFLANFSIVAYISSNLIILGFFSNNLIVGYYSIAEKIIMAMRQILAVFSQAIYPHICKLATNSHAKIIQFYKQVYLPFIVLFALFSIAVFIGAEHIIALLAHNVEPEIVNALRLLCFVPFIVGLNIPANQTLLAYKFNKSYTTILTIGSILNVVINLSLVQSLGMLGTIYSVIITETVITIALHLSLKYQHRRFKLF